MRETTFSSPYLLFAGEGAQASEDFRGPFIRVQSARNGLNCRLTEEEFALASLFNGQNTANLRLEQARKTLNAALSSRDLERYTHMLTDAGLLWAGADEALPVPPQTDAEVLRHEQMSHGAPHEHALPPSTSPGSLAAPSSGSGPIAGSPMRPRDAEERIDWPFSPQAFLWLGRIFTAPLYWPYGLTLLALFSIAILTGLWTDQHEAATDFQRLLIWQNLIFVGLPSALLTNFIAHIARAAVIHKESGEMPRFGINLLMGVLPRFMTDTEGPAERLDRRGRGYVLSAGLGANLLLFTLFLLGWFLVRQSTTMLPAVMITAGLFGLGNALLRLNPLARTDGYYLLAFRLGVPDLREQAVLTLAGRRERWGNRKAPSTKPILVYGVLVILFLISILTLFVLYPARWLEAHYAGAGISILIVAVGYYVLTLRKQFADHRGAIGGLPLNSRLRRDLQNVRKRWRGLTLLAIAALWPYTYEPGGRFHIQPAARAEVPAQIAGIIRQVEVAEGDWLNSGDVIARIDDLQLQSQLRRAQADLARTQAQLSEARNGATTEEVELARATVITAIARLRSGQTEADRAVDAHNRKAITSQERDRTVSHAQVLQDELTETQRQLELVESPTRQEEIDALEAALQSQQADLELVEEQIRRMVLRAPVDGYVVSQTLRYALGRYVAAGDVIAVLEDNRTLAAELNLPEFAAQHVKLGAPATLKAWMMPDKAYLGVVTQIAPSAELGENGRIVRVRIEVRNPDQALLPDMSGQAKVQAQRGPALIAFSRALVRFVRIEIWSWLP